jgi:hypothetical protein
VEKLSGVIAVFVLVLAASAACAPGSSGADAVTPVAVTSTPRVSPTSVPPPAARPTVTAQRPAEVLDLSGWYLTLPTGEEGDPDTVRQPALAGYSDRYFRLDAATGGVAFTANAGGVTTSGSDYPRTELREMDGADQAAWSNETGVHTMRLRAAVTELPAMKPEVVTAQIHDGDDDVVEVRLEGEHLLVEYDDGDQEVTIDPEYRLGTPFDLEIVAAAGRIEVGYDGEAAAVVDRAGSGWFFKAGSYLQSNPERGDGADAVGTVVIYALDVVHTP